MQRSVNTWLLITDQEPVLDQEAFLAYLNDNYYQFVPAWFRLCSAISRNTVYNRDFYQPQTISRDELASKIFSHFKEYQESAIDTNALREDGHECLLCLQRFLNVDRYHLQEFSDPEYLVANAIWILFDRHNPDEFADEIELADRVRIICKVNFITDYPDEATVDLTKYCKWHWSIYRYCLPRWVRSVESALARNKGKSISEDNDLRFLLEDSTEPLLQRAYPANQSAAMRAFRNLAIDFPGFRDFA
jgi:hypothetical protein